jgi:hypothetical protein
MITFSSLGTYGNLGNQLFQIASTVGLAQQHGHPFFFPPWEYGEILERPLPVGRVDPSFQVLDERVFNYHDWHIGAGNYDLRGYLQSEKYFATAGIREILRLRSDFSEAVMSKNAMLFERETIFISVRRGDFVGNPSYFQLPYKYYILALMNSFPDWESCNLIFASDDPNYVLQHFSFLPNAFVLADHAPFEQLAIAMRCDHFVISNSTFSWWAAWLGEKPYSIVIRPIKNFDGEWRRKHSDVDYFPDRWIALDHRGMSLARKFPALYLRGEWGELAIMCNSMRKRIRPKIRRLLVRKGRSV